MAPVTFVCKKCNATISGEFATNEEAQAVHDSLAHPSHKTPSRKEINASRKKFSLKRPKELEG